MHMVNITCTKAQGNTTATWDAGEPLHIEFSLHVLGTQHVMNIADKMSRKLSLKLCPIL